MLLQIFWNRKFSQLYTSRLAIENICFFFFFPSIHHIVIAKLQLKLSLATICNFTVLHWSVLALAFSKRLIALQWLTHNKNVAASVPSKKTSSYWTNVCFSEHAVAQPCRHTTNEAFQAIKALCDVYTIFNLECCKCATMRFHYANDLVVLPFVHLRGNNGCSINQFFWRHAAHFYELFQWFQALPNILWRPPIR